MASSQTASSIEVAVRVRPMRGELHESKPAWKVDATSLTEMAQPDNTFTFDRVYDSRATTAEVYKNNVRDAIVARIVQGYNGTVFAYGQTGSGKSFTMFGDSEARSPGLIRLAVHDIFKALATQQQRKPYLQIEVFVSVLEIYNEQLRDLLQTDANAVAAGTTTAATAAAAAASSRASVSSSGPGSPLAPPPAPPLSIRENEYGVYVHNAVRTQVTSEEECTRVIYSHAATRVSAATLMNEHSSRSHCVIRISVEQSHYLEDAASGMDNEDGENDDDGEDESVTATQGEDDDENDVDEKSESRFSSLSNTGTADSKKAASHSTVTTAAAAKKKKTASKHRKKILSTLNMVDLAGSERVAKTGATGLRMLEGGHINKSLTTLTTVINRLASDGANATRSSGGTGTSATAFIPYRDSRLTHLLKTALGGNSFTAVLCCITPALESANESRSTLQFASRAKKIQNKVRVNEVANAQTRVRELEAALRHAKKMLVAQTLYLWSKQLKIRHYEAQLSSGGDASATKNKTLTSSSKRLVSTGAPDHGGNDSDSDVDGTYGASAPQRSRSMLMNQGQQQSMIIAQLSAQNEALRDTVRTLTAQLEKLSVWREDRLNNTEKGSATPGASASTAAATAAAEAAEVELQRIRHSLESTQRLLKERETALQAAQASLDELDGLCRELEAENKTQAERMKSLGSRNTEAEELMAAVEDEHASLQHENGLLRTQLQQSQSKLLEKHRGDDYLAELTKLHVDHQHLQYSYTQLKEKADREKAELVQRLQRLTERNNSLEDDLDEAKDETQLANSYLWRLLAAAAQVTQGKPLAIKDSAASVRDAQVAEAVRALTSFAALSAADSAQQHKNSHDSSSPSSPTSNAGGRDNVRQLQSRICALEEQLIAKDAQRDVIIDTKLKRIQGLVLRLHTMNVALTAEMRHCFHDNEQLFEIAMKSSKTQKKVEKAGLQPRSLESALDRARFAQPPHKPLYHN